IRNHSAKYQRCIDDKGTLEITDGLFVTKGRSNDRGSTSSNKRRSKSRKHKSV
ncbi:hypothetical protein HN51_028211, partial [Arachis hypogaea]